METVVTVKQEELDRLMEICEELASKYKDIKSENKRLKEMLEPKKIDLDKYNQLDLSDIQLNTKVY